MKKTLVVGYLILFGLVHFSFSSMAQEHYIFFYPPYTDKSETNLYRDTNIKFDYLTQYTNIKSSIVANDVKNAIAHNDYRFIGISGNSYLYPGLEGGYEKEKNGETTFVSLARKYEKYLNRYHFKVIKGTSDALRSDLPPLQSIAYDYAKRYNAILFLKIKEMEKNSRNQ